MEPALPGPRATLVCPQCKNAFDLLVPCSPSERPQAPFAFPTLPRVQPCPLCGFTTVPVKNESIRVALVKVCSKRFRPRRYEPIVFLGDNEQFIVKRLIGLPGEQIAIRAGDVFVDGKILVKSPSVALQQAVAVTSIQRVNEPNFIRFVHRKPVPWDKATERTNTQPDFPITNECEIPTFAQTTTNVEYVRDFILSFDWIPTTSHSPGPIVSYHDGSRRYRIAIGSVSKTSHIDIICCDRQINVLIDGKTVHRKRLKESATVAPVTEPFAIQAATGRVEKATVFRDLHYSPGPNGANMFDIPHGEYFVLGDNSPVSRDDRFQSHHFVQEHNVIGFVDTSSMRFQELEFQSPAKEQQYDHDTP